MIRVFNGNDTVFTSNGDKIIKPIEAIITKGEEEYLELEAPLQYAEFLIQDNILVVDTPTGKKGYIIFNPVISNTVFVKAYLHYQELPSSPADRGVTISHGKNLENCKVAESWDNVVTKLTPIGYNDVTLPEGHISIISPYQKAYEKTIEFELPESLVEQIEAMEEEISTNDSLVASLENSVVVLNAKIPAFDTSVTSLQGDISTLQERYNVLDARPDKTETELKEMAVIEAQIPLINEDIASFLTDKANSQLALSQVRTDLVTAKAELVSAKAGYDALIITDLRRQAQEYFNVNKYPQINYDLEAHLEGIVEIGDTVKVKHPDMRVDLLTAVTGYKLDILTFKFRQVEFGTPKLTLKGKLTEIEEKIEDTKETIKQVGRSITKYKSEYKRDNEEMVSKFTSELYGTQGGIYKMLEKNQSVMRQTASEISGTVSRVNADLSSDISSLSIKADDISATVTANYSTLSNSVASVNIRADSITSTVSSNYTTLNGKITNNTSLISQTATAIRSEVATSINGVTQSISEVEQTADKISWLVKSGTSSSTFTLTDRVATLMASALNIDSLVTFTNLSTVNTSTTINGGNIKAGTLDCSKITVTNLNAGSITTGNLNATRISGGTLNCSNITVSNLSASSITTGTLSADRITSGILDASKITVKNLSANSITTGKLSVDYIGLNGNWIMGEGSSSNALKIGSSYYSWASIVEMYPSTLRLGISGGTIGFYGASGQYKKTVSNISTSATLTEAVSKLNALIDALQDYGLVASS